MRTLPVAVLALLSAGILPADPITYTFTTTGTGTLAGVPFTDAAITVTSDADTGGVTSYVVDSNTIYDNFPSATTLGIAGFAPATFNDPTFWEDPNGAGDIVFGVVSSSVGLAFCTNCDALLGMTALLSGLESYDLATSFGPVSSAYDFESNAFDAFRNIGTSDGVLSLTAANDTFTAVTPSPEPASFLLTGLGLAGLLVSHKLPRKKHFVGLSGSAWL